MDYLELLKTLTPEKQMELFSKNKPKFAIEQDDAIKQYKIESHSVMDTTMRPDKTAMVDTGLTDPVTREPILRSKPVQVTRIAIPFQKLIVGRRTGFMLTNPVRLSLVSQSDPKTGEQKEDTQGKKMQSLIEGILQDNKCDYKNKEIARRLMSEMEVAELWYFIDNKKKIAGTVPKFTVKMRILSKELGDSLYPLFDSTGDMIAFGRKYIVNENGDNIEHFDYYTAEEAVLMKKDKTAGWILDPDEEKNPIPNQIGKIQVVYYSQLLPEWNDVQPMIERYETLFSNHGEMNEYFGAPILTITGRMLGAAQKGEQGSVLELENGAKAAFLALNSPPESIAMEEVNLRDTIYAMSQTPNITFDNLKSIGNISGVALELMFMDAFMAVGTKEEIFGIGQQRRINLLKYCIGYAIDTSLKGVVEDIQIKPVITPYMPKNVKERIEMLAEAKTAGIMSTQTCIEQNDLVPDKEAEVKRLEKEKEAESAQMQADFEMQSAVIQKTAGPKPNPNQNANNKK